MNVNSTISSKTYVPIKTGGIERIRIDNNGNMGIGTITPTTSLDISGNSRISTNSGVDGTLFVGNAKINYKNSNSNLSIGSLSLTTIENGSNNVALGNNTLTNNLVAGINNLALGHNVLNANTNGDDNVGVGYNSLSLNTTGNYNIAVGSGALSNVQSGSSNVAVGRNAGSILSTGSNNTYIGDSIISGSSSSNNETVIGSNITGLGSNSVLIGKSGTNTKTFINSTQVGINTTTPQSTLDVNGTAIFRGTLDLSGNTITNIANPVSPYSDTDITTVDFVNICIPIGTIIMWNSLTPPTNWRICDGTNGTPNLLGRFIYSSQQVAYPSQLTGGTSTVSLTNSNLPSHTHTFSGSTITTSNSTTNITFYDAGHAHTYTSFQAGPGIQNGSGAPGTASTGSNTGATQAPLSYYDPTHNHSVSITASTQTTGAGSSIQNIPPYYVLVYIMRFQ